MNGVESTGMGGGAAAVSSLSKEKLAELSLLRVTDQRVRAHEQAHMAAAGQYATGGPSFQYVTGPDNQRYAAICAPCTCIACPIPSSLVPAHPHPPQ